MSARGLGTRNRTDPVLVGLQKTRLFDPTLNFLGTNDHPGDYRSSGCTACHVIYANDRSPVNSGPYAAFGHLGLSAQADPTIPSDEPGHPIQHRFTVAIPTSQCIVCHIHPGTNVLNSYTGYMWWDEETDGELMYPAEQKKPTAEEFTRSMMSNPDETAARGNWSDPAFLERVAELNPRARHIQFADYHGHGWVFRAVFKKDRHGQLLDHRGEPVTDPSTAALMAAVRLPAELKERYRSRNAAAEQQAAFNRAESKRDGLPVHQLDIHLEKGMHCVDCHFIQDAHGNTKLYGEVRAAIEIQCSDCHGTPTQRASLVTSGPASDTSAAESGKDGRDLSALRTPFRERRFERRGDAIIQRSMVERDLAWEITQVADTIDPRSPHYNQCAHLAKTVRFEGNDIVWGDIPAGKEKACAHASEKMSCIACHSAWNPSCFGCHLPQRPIRRCPSSTTRATSRATTSPTISRRCAMTYSCWRRTATRPATELGQHDRRAPSTSGRMTPIASRSTSSSRRSRARGCRGSLLARTCRTPCGEVRRSDTIRADRTTAAPPMRVPINPATPTRRPARTAISRRMTTTTRSWPSS